MLVTETLLFPHQYKIESIKIIRIGKILQPSFNNINSNCKYQVLYGSFIMAAEYLKFLKFKRHTNLCRIFSAISSKVVLFKGNKFNTPSKLKRVRKNLRNSDIKYKIKKYYMNLFLKKFFL